jgi:hypothetical protein
MEGLRPDMFTNMATIGNSYVWSRSISKKNLEMNQNLVGSIYGRSSINFCHFISIRLQSWLP